MRTKWLYFRDVIQCGVTHCGGGRCVAPSSHGNNFLWQYVFPTANRLRKGCGMIKEQQDIFFVPILFSYKQWFDEKDYQNLIPLMVKGATVLNCTDSGRLTIELVDVFLIDPLEDVLPPAPKTQFQIDTFLSTIIHAVENDRDVSVDIAGYATIIYGGKVITTKNATNHNNYNK